MEQNNNVKLRKQKENYVNEFDELINIIFLAIGNLENPLFPIVIDYNPFV